MLLNSSTIMCLLCGLYMVKHWNDILFSFEHPVIQFISPALQINSANCGNKKKQRVGLSC